MELFLFTGQFFSSANYIFFGPNILDAISILAFTLGLLATQKLPSRPYSAVRGQGAHHPLPTPVT